MHFSSSRSSLGLLFILLLSLAEEGINFRLLHQRVLQQREENAKQEAYHRLKLLAKDWSYRDRKTIIEDTIKQPVNHFNKQNTLTFKQRYWAFDSYWNQPDGPVFLLIGGNSPLSFTSVLAGHHVELAHKYGALLVALEHRFYGESINPDGLESHNLQFLTSQQALSDLFSFHGFVTRKYKLKSNNTWIFFGGSYAGNLAAWFRLKFPHLVFAAVASSAPVKAQLDFTGYNQVVGQALLNPDIGGSKECQKAVAEAFSTVDGMLRAGELIKLGQDFHSCFPLKGPDDFPMLVGNLASFMKTTVKYNEHNPFPSVKILCDVMTNNKIETAYSRLIAFNNISMKNINSSCMSNSKQRMVQLLRRTDLSMAGWNNRQWLFQTCTELGYFQTCENSTCPFSRYITLQDILDTCKQVFNITSESIQQTVSFTNDYYGADHPAVSRVLFVNGDMDPWHVLSVLRNRSGSTAILIKGASHFADMLGSRSNDRLSLVKARKQISSQIGTWLELARNMTEEN